VDDLCSYVLVTFNHSLFNHAAINHWRLITAQLITQTIKNPDV